MRVLRGHPRVKVPVWNSYFVSGVPEFLYNIVKGSSKFASSYHRALKLLEVNKSTLDFMVEQCHKHNIPVEFEGEDLPIPELRLFEDDPNFKYQEEAAEQLYKMPNALLQFGVGSGKTRITLLALSKRFEANPNLRVLVVTGLAGLQNNWLTDSEKFNLCRGKITITGVGNTKESLKMIENAKDGDVLVANFDMLSRAELLTALLRFDPNIVVFDEVQMAVNMGNKRVSGAMRTEGLHELQGDHWSLSASPIQFSPFDWRSLLIWLRVFPQEMTQSSFENYYGIFGFNYMGQRVCQEYRNVEELLPLVNSIRLVFGGTALPELIVKNIPVPDGDKKSAYNIQHYNNCINSHKIKFIKDLDIQCCVACNITKPFEVWKDELTKCGKRVEIFDGTLTMDERNKLLDRCNAGEVDVLLLSLTAGGTGLNLARAFHFMAFIDCPNSLVLYWQGYGRLYRIGATQPVTICRVYCEGTKDEQRWKQIYKDFEAIKIFYEF